MSSRIATAVSFRLRKTNQNDEDSRTSPFRANSLFSTYFSFSQESFVVLQKKCLSCIPKKCLKEAFKANKSKMSLKGTHKLYERSARVYPGNKHTSPYLGHVSTYQLTITSTENSSDTVRRTITQSSFPLSLTVAEPLGSCYQHTLPLLSRRRGGGKARQGCLPCRCLYQPRKRYVVRS